jgi:putative tricarboxylic transport membrane protein
MALLLGALLIHGVQPGPLILVQHPEIFWGTVASMYMGNLLLVVLNLPLIGIWVKILKVPYRILFPLILLFCLIGAYSVGMNVFDLYVMIIFGVVGYFLRKWKYEPAPLVLAFVLGPMLEQNLRQALLISEGNLTTFFTRPLSAISLSIAVLLLLSAVIPSFQNRRKLMIAEE